jgi:glycopeptide antibiotics resistance protein
VLFSFVFRSIGLALSVLAPLVVALALVVLWRRRTRTWRGATLPVARLAVLPVAIAAILVVTLRPGDAGIGGGFNLEPFRDLRMSLASGVLVDIPVQNLFGNLAMFVPFGVAAAWTFPGRSIAVVTVAALVLSTTIEIIQSQPGIGRSADITDVMMNTTGAALGALAWRVFARWRGTRLA